MYFTKYYFLHKVNEKQYFLINTLTGAKDVVNVEIAKKIENIKDINQIEEIFSEKLLQQLKDRKYVFEEEKEEQEIILKYQKMYQIMRKKREVTDFTICPTMGCNLRCVYCFEADDLHREFEQMSLEQLNVIFSYILDVKERNSKECEDKYVIKLFGGEPLLKQNYELVKRIFEFGRENHIMVSVITNGTTIEEYIELLSKYRECVSVQITLDGNKEIHDKRRIRADGSGTFIDICRNVNCLLKREIPVKLRVNIDKKNIAFIGELKNVINEYKWNENENILIYASPVVDFEMCDSDNSDTFKEHEILKALSEELEPDGLFQLIVSPMIGYMQHLFSDKLPMVPWKIDYCEATSGGSLIFSPKGEITTCLTCIGRKGGVIGHFDNNGVSLEVEQLKKWWERSTFSLEKCKDCKYIMMCGGGCPVKAIEMNGDIYCPVCSDIENTLKTYVDLYGMHFL